MNKEILNMRLMDTKEYKNNREFIKAGGMYLRLTTPEHRMTRPIYKYYKGYMYEEEGIEIPEHTSKGWLIYVKDEIRKVKRIM